MIKNSHKGIFIVFEGIDGCGKSTQAKLLVEYLKSLNYKTVLTREHTRKGKWGINIEKALHKKIKIPPSLKFQEWFIKDRLYHLKNIIIPKLKNRYIVISDRYWLSTIAYGAGGGISQSKLIRLHEKILKKYFILSNITFFIDVPIKIISKRLAVKKNKSFFEEKISFLEKTKAEYVKIAEKMKNKENIHVITGKKTIKAVFKDIKNIFDEYCDKKQSIEVRL